MAKNKTLTLKGKVFWAQLFEDNREMFEYNEETASYDKPSATKGTYQLELHLDSDEYMSLRKSGSDRTKYSKITDEGLESIRVKRPHEKFSKKGDLMTWACGAPAVTKPDGTPWVFEDDGILPNESVVEVDLELYDAGAYKGITRLQSVKVIEVASLPDTDKGPEADEPKSNDEEIPF